MVFLPNAPVVSVHSFLLFSEGDRQDRRNGEGHLGGAGREGTGRTRSTITESRGGLWNS